VGGSEHRARVLGTLVQMKTAAAVSRIEGVSYSLSLMTIFAIAACFTNGIFASFSRAAL
jgi:hypothetical protein